VRDFGGFMNKRELMKQVFCESIDEASDELIETGLRLALLSIIRGLLELPEEDYE
jgi:hypothetical protein